MRSLPPLLLYVVSLLSVASIVTHHAVALVGEYKRIGDVGDPYVVGIGKFAVAEHNKQVAGQQLVFIRVVSGEEQLVAGTNYRLVIEAGDAAGAKKAYEAVVYDRPRDKLRSLTSFKPIP